MLRKLAKNSIEILEQRIAPAGILNEAGFKTASPGYNIVHAGEGLTTGNGAGSGNYLLYVEKGTAYVFVTDLNNNKIVDFNEITGIAAGDGLRLISFVDIHGDIVTNLTASTTLSDSDNNPLNDDAILRGDGRVLLNHTIEKIELRSVTASDFAVNSLTDQDGDGEVDEAYINNRLVLSSYSIYGNILAGKGFGVPDGGLIIDTAGADLQATRFTPGNTSPDYYVDFKPSIGSIKTGTAASGQYFTFGISRGTDVQGYLSPFVPAVGQAGGDIINVRAADQATIFNINSLEAGNGGIGARGGNVVNVQLNNDNAGGYRVYAGDGGRGASGGAGGSVVNFADFGSITGYVLIKTGSGGLGSTGVGGAGGNATFGTLNLNGNVNVELGTGGNGFTGGGNGASLPLATITTPEGAVQFGLNITGTARDLARNMTPSLSDGIGTHLPIDFNEDGFGDFVYTSADPNQLVVVLGSPVANQTGDQFIWGFDDLGAPIYKKVYLDGPTDARAVQVADFNGDGHQDIVVGSSSLGDFAGVTVFLNQFDAADTEFRGFELGRTSPLPSLYAGDPDGGVLFATNFLFRRSANAISDIAAGDFNGDGITDVAVVATYYFGLTVTPYQVVLFMTNDVENGKPTGTFYADFGTKATAVPPAFANPLLPFTYYQGATGSVIIEASELAEGNANDALFVAKLPTYLGPQGIIEIYDNSVPSILGPTPLGLIALGKVDTDRDLPDGNNQHISLADATLLEFVVLDSDGDGFADIAALLESPAGFVVTAQGNGLGGLAISSNVGQNAGIFFGDKGFEVGTNLKAIRATDADGDGLVDEIAVLNYSSNVVKYTVNLVSIAQPANTNGNATPAGGVLSDYSLNPGRDDTVVAFDSFRPIVGSNTFTYGVALPTKIENDFHVMPFSVGAGAIGSFLGVPLVDYAIKLTAGDGGNALIGKGGVGGFIGGGLRSAIDPLTGQPFATGAVNISLPANLAYSADVRLIAGGGGNGFSTGGNGGNVTGVSARYVGNTLTSTVSVLGGDGGFGVSGAGGNGGNLSSNSIESGELFQAGNGGRGSIGGNGGSVIGNGVKNLFDSRDLYVEAHAGSGGAGVKRGGNGGDVSKFQVNYIGTVAQTGGELFYTAGDGGNAAAGPGGKGGSILNSSPLDGVNKMAGEIYLGAGHGGMGTVGGAGGSIVNFVNRPSQANNPTVVSILAGNGGAGVSGAGGAGGGISGINVPSSGVPDPLGTVVSGYAFDRFIAGNGGYSGAAKGGVGGSISGMNVSATEGAIAIIAGAGGAGLTAGGNGGSVTNNLATSGQASQSKILVVAGAGGDAYAFTTNPLDNPAANLGRKAFGGKIGIGGAGGNISGFTQETSTGARVDLIAGNGGSTINYGTVADSKFFVGKGGSITNVRIEGSIGSGHAQDVTNPSLTPLDREKANIPILSYTDIDGNGTNDVTMAQFVETFLRLSPEAAFFGAPILDDNTGNVGIIVGAAGRIKSVEISPGVFTALPATNVDNGSLSNVTARNLMSAVAGDVNQIAAIQAISGLKIGAGTGVNFLPGIVGSDKDPTLAPFPQPPDPNAIFDPTPGDIRDYLDPNGDGSVEPKLDGRLIDGAVVAHKITGALAGRVYLR